MSQLPSEMNTAAAAPAGGDVATLLRAQDWSGSPLGPAASWPAALRTVVDLMLGSKFPMFAAWGPELGFLYNDAYAEILGAKHPAALGARFEDVWPEIWAEIAPLIESALSGEAVYREDLPLRVRRRGFEEDAWFTFSYSPIDDGTGAAGGMFCAVAETTAKMRSARRQTLRLTLDEVLGHGGEPQAMMDAAVKALARYFDARRVGYSEAQAEGDAMAFVAGYADGVAPFAGAYPSAELGAEQGGAAESRTFVSTPVMRDGRRCAALHLESAEPRLWSQEDAALLDHVAGRIWDAAQGARVEHRLRESEARFRNMADHAPLMMWVTDPDGVCTYLNRAWYEFTGQTEAEALGYGWLEATHPEDKAPAEAAFRTANAQQSPFRMEYRLRRSDGTYRWAIDAAGPRFAEDGAYLGYVGSVIDIQDRREAEEQIRHSEEQMRTLMNAMPAFVWLAGPDGAINYFNDRWYEYTGQTPAEALNSGWIATLHPDDAARTAQAWRRALSLGVEYQIEVRYRRRDGVYRWYLARAEPVRDAAGRVTTWLGASIDIDDNKLAADHQSLLINELNHRVKNTLATVQSMATQTVRRDGDPRGAHEAFMSRLMALSAAHNVLTERRWTGAELHEVVEGAARTFSDWPSTQFRTDGPSVWLPPKAALALAMAFHELGTNASKYGALSTPDGVVSLAWSMVQGPSGPRLRLTWREAGGPGVAAPLTRGFGSRLLERGLAAELGGVVRLDFRPAGLVCEIEAELEASEQP